jgi:hypothetical protein
MDFQKSKLLLEKINALYRNISGDPRNISSIERDLMRSYVQQFYESLLDMPTVASAISPPAAAPEPKPVEPKITLRKPEAIQAQPKPEPVKVEKIPEPAPAPTPIEGSKPAEAPTTVTTPPPPPPPVREVPPPTEVSSPTAPITQPSPAIDPDLEALFSFKTATELSEKLSQLPIGDIKKAMGLNERISTQYELFGSDGAVFEATISHLNDLRSYEDAKNYLVKNVAVKFNWTGKEKKEKAKEFIKLIRRRYQA